MYEKLNPPKTKEECLLQIEKKKAEIASIQARGEYSLANILNPMSSKEKKEKINVIKKEIADLKVRMLQLE